MHSPLCLHSVFNNSVRAGCKCCKPLQQVGLKFILNGLKGSCYTINVTRISGLKFSYALPLYSFTHPTQQVVSLPLTDSIKHSPSNNYYPKKYSLVQYQILCIDSYILAL